ALCIEQVARAQRPLGLFSFRDIWINLNRSRKRHENKSSARSEYFLVHCDDKGISDPPGFLPDLVLGLHEFLVEQPDVVCLPWDVMTLADHHSTTCLIDEFQAPRVMDRLEKKTAVKMIEANVSERVINDKLPVAQLIEGLVGILDLRNQLPGVACNIVAGTEREHDEIGREIYNVQLQSQQLLVSSITANAEVEDLYLEIPEFRTTR